MLLNQCIDGYLMCAPVIIFSFKYLAFSIYLEVVLIDVLNSVLLKINVVDYYCKIFILWVVYLFFILLRTSVKDFLFFIFGQFNRNLKLCKFGSSYGRKWQV